MKKLLMFLIGIGLVLSLGMSAVAADNVVAEDSTVYSNAGDLRGLVEVSYDIQQAIYSVTIPASFDFTDYGTVPNTVVYSSLTANHVILTNNEMLVVSVKSTHDWNLTEQSRNSGAVVDNPKKIPYTLHFPALTTESVPSGILDNPTVLADSVFPNYEEIFWVPTGTEKLTAKLKFTLLETPDSLGMYKDALTFNIQIRAQPSP